MKPKLKIIKNMKPNNDQLQVLNRYINMINLSLLNHRIEPAWIDGNDFVISLQRKRHLKDRNNSLSVRKNNIESVMSYLNGISDLDLLK